MILRQLFEEKTSTFTYLLADQDTLEAVLIDPVRGELAKYESLINELGLTLKHALDTHVHADHITALGLLRDKLGCRTFSGHKGSVACSDSSLEDGMEIRFGQLTLQALYTPGHTDDSYCFVLLQKAQPIAVFTGDTLLINGSGRTDFQNGSAEQLYDSLHGVLMNLPEAVAVYPGHDYRGRKVSSIGEEKRLNPRLQWSRAEFIDGMAKLDLPNPAYMDVAIPANRQCGKLFDKG